MIAFCQYLIYLPSWEYGSQSLTILPTLLSPQILSSFGAEGFINQLRHCYPRIKIGTHSLNDSLSPIVLKRAFKASDRDIFFNVDGLTDIIDSSGVLTREGGDVCASLQRIWVGSSEDTPPWIAIMSFNWSARGGLSFVSRPNTFQ